MSHGVRQVRFIVPMATLLWVVPVLGDRTFGATQGPLASLIAGAWAASSAAEETDRMDHTTERILQLLCLTEAQRKLVAASTMHSPQSVMVLDVLSTGETGLSYGELIVGGAPVFGANWCSKRLCLRSGKVFVVVDEPAKLAGHVEIRTPRAALQYVRIFTSRLTVLCLKPTWWVEVLRRSDLADTFPVGWYRWDVSPDEWRFRSGIEGVLSDEDWVAAGLGEPQVEEVEDGFVITRPLFTATPYRSTTNMVFVVREHVGRDGSLRREVVRTVRLPETRLWLHVQHI
jgi:hypothetical protein